MSYSALDWCNTGESEGAKVAQHGCPTAPPPSPGFRQPNPLGDPTEVGRLPSGAENWSGIEERMS